MAEDGAVSCAEGVAEFATFGDDGGSEGGGMAGEATWKGEVFAEVSNSLCVAGGLGVDLLKVAVEEEVSLEGRKAVAGAEDELKSLSARGEKVVEVGVDGVDAGTGAPVAKEAGLNISSGERSLE